MAISIDHAELEQDVFMNQDPLRLGVVGVGDVAQRDYLPEIDRLKPEAVVVAVAAAAAERGRETARRLAIPRWYVGYEGLIADEEVECVIDLAPAPLHEEVNGAAIEAGKALHSEKPLALTAAAARSLGAAANARGLALTAAPSVLVFPQVQMVGSLLRSGALGSPVAASGAAFGGVPPWEGFASDPSSAPELEILGDSGGAACSLLDPASPVRSEGEDGWTELPIAAERTAGPDHILGVRHLIRCVRGLERPVLTADHAAHVLDVIEAARRSTAESRIVDVSDAGWAPVPSQEG
jgi:predicted dehydrogenase